MSVPQTDALDHYATIAVLVSISKTVKYYTINLSNFNIFFHKNKKIATLNFCYILAIAQIPTTPLATCSPVIPITRIAENTTTNN